MIHNGIIENFRELRDGLEARGHVLTSETDTEAIAHLVEEAYEGDLADAVRAALRQLEGAYALVVMHKRRVEPARRGAQERAARRGPQRRGELHRERRRGDPRPHQPGHLPRGGRRRRRPADGCRDDRRRRRAARARGDDRSTGSPEAAEKGGYDHFMLKEIHEQPDGAPPVAGRAGHAGRPHPGARGRRARRTRSDGSTRVELVACGTASYAALVGAAAIQDWTGLPARVTVGSEFRYSPPPLDANTLVVAVTQSGETADTIAPTRWAREQGCPIVAVTNTVGSAITREADAVMFLQAGPEIAVAASKTFVTQVTTLIVLAAAIAKARGSMGAEQELELGQALRALPDGRGPDARANAGHRGDRAAVRQLARLHVHRPRLLATRRRSRARSSSRRSATCTPRAMPRAS